MKEALGRKEGIDREARVWETPGCSLFFFVRSPGHLGNFKILCLVMVFRGQGEGQKEGKTQGGVLWKRLNPEITHTHRKLENLKEDLFVTSKLIPCPGC